MRTGLTLFVVSLWLNVGSFVSAAPGAPKRSGSLPGAATIPSAPKAKPAGTRASVGTRIFQLTVDVGASGCTDTHCQYTDPLVYLRVQPMFRFLRYAAAGVSEVVIRDGDEDDETLASDNRCHLLYLRMLDLQYHLIEVQSGHINNRGNAGQFEGRAILRIGHAGDNSLNAGAVGQ